MPRQIATLIVNIQLQQSITTKIRAIILTTLRRIPLHTTGIYYC